ncbi:MAG TPA: MmcQ/YjbR family DNA-binding protein [Arcobacter sp.]|jgi:predicted DNA-binding protein (MmcQ/YjbR family)|nr:MmcQ/YjbR family DNA-binding protein [Arcobacter sp.]
MDEQKLEKYLLSKKGTSKEFPFGDYVTVFKVMGKMFAVFSHEDNPQRINLKATPEDCIAFREIYDCVIPGYHMNKKHWNTIILDGSMEDDSLKLMIDDSYDLIVSKLTKKQKEELLTL